MRLPERVRRTTVMFGCEDDAAPPSPVAPPPKGKGGNKGRAASPPATAAARPAPAQTSRPVHNTSSAKPKAPEKESPVDKSDAHNKKKATTAMMTAPIPEKKIETRGRKRLRSPSPSSSTSSRCSSSGSSEGAGAAVSRRSPPASNNNNNTKKNKKNEKESNSETSSAPPLPQPSSKTNPAAPLPAPVSSLPPLGKEGTTTARTGSVFAKEVEEEIPRAAAPSAATQKHHHHHHQPQPRIAFYSLLHKDRVGVLFCLTTGDVGVFFRDRSCMTLSIPTFTAFTPAEEGGAANNSNKKGNLLPPPRQSSALRLAYCNPHGHRFLIQPTVAGGIVAVPKRLERKVHAVLWCRDVLLTPSCFPQVFLKSSSLLSETGGGGGGSENCIHIVSGSGEREGSDSSSLPIVSEDQFRDLWRGGQGGNNNHNSSSTVTKKKTHHNAEEAGCGVGAAAVVPESREGEAGVTVERLLCQETGSTSSSAPEKQNKKKAAVVHTGRVVECYGEWIDEVVVPLDHNTAASVRSTAPTTAARSTGSACSGKKFVAAASSSSSSTSSSSQHIPISIAPLRVILPVFVRGIGFLDREDAASHETDEGTGLPEDCTSAESSKMNASKKKLKTILSRPTKKKKGSAASDDDDDDDNGENEVVVFTLSNAAQPYPNGVYYCSDTE